MIDSIIYTKLIKNCNELDTIFDKKISFLGKIIATSDLVSQLSDRYYLEKCRDFLWEEFKFFNINFYSSKENLLEQTDDFYINIVKNKLENSYDNVYKLLDEYFYPMDNPYQIGIDKNINFIKKIKKENINKSLKRIPKNITKIDIKEQLNLNEDTFNEHQYNEKNWDESWVISSIKYKKAIKLTIKFKIDDSKNISYIIT